MSNTESDEVAVKLEWSWNGLTAKIKSRLLSAADKVGARKIEARGLSDEHKVSLNQALTDSRLVLIGAATKALSAELEQRPDLARRALSAFARAEQKVENVEAAFALAVEDLCGDPELQLAASDEGPDSIDADVISRWQHYAEGANSELLRERWGRVLASEIRSPGTFSMKVLRIVDELEPNVAVAFEQLCRNRLSNWIPSLSLAFKNGELDSLLEADLIHSSGFPVSVDFGDAQSAEGTRWWSLRGSRAGIAVRKDAELSGIPRQRIGLDDIRIQEGKLRINVIKLTTIGQSLSKILQYSETHAFETLYNNMLPLCGDGDINLIRSEPDVNFDDGGSGGQYPAGEA